MRIRGFKYAYNFKVNMRQGQVTCNFLHRHSRAFIGLRCSYLPEHKLPIPGQNRLKTRRSSLEHNSAPGMIAHYEALPRHRVPEYKELVAKTSAMDPDKVMHQIP